MSQARTEDAGKAIPLPLLDGGRFVAAALVMLYHYTIAIKNFFVVPPLDGLFRGGHSGVEYFFVLSGFIILYSHRGDLGHRDRVGSFFAKRAIRILPMLWAALIVWGLLRHAMSGETTRGTTGLGTILLDMLLLPHEGAYVLGVTWTLTRELIFYLLFALTIWNRRIGWTALIAWQLCVIVYAIRGVPMGAVPNAFFETHNLGFGLGLLIGLLVTSPPPRRPAIIALAGALLYTGFLVGEWRIGGPGDLEVDAYGEILSPLLYLSASAILVFGLVGVDRLRRAAKSRLLTWAGGCSYVLYLIHVPVGSFMVRIVGKIGRGHLPPVAVLIIMSIAAVAIALAIHLWVEKPIIRYLRGQLARATARRRDAAQVLPEPMES